MEGAQLLGGRYALLDQLGTGGMAVVWRARDEVLGRPVAVKVLAGRHAGEPDARDRIRAEARAAAALSHPNIAQVYDYGEAHEGGASIPYVVMELVRGNTLQHRMDSGPMSPRFAMRVAAEVAAALAAAHADGLVHRDIKPANVMVTETGAKVVDFGIAAAVNPAGTGEEEFEVLGTPAYLAPERLIGDGVEPASDVYALGVLLYRMLSGQSPWSADTTTQMLAAHIYVDPEPLPEGPGVPDYVTALCNRCLSKDTTQRPSAREAAALLAQGAGLRVVQDAPPAAAAAGRNGPSHDHEPSVLIRPRAARSLPPPRWYDDPAPTGTGSVAATGSGSVAAAGSGSVAAAGSGSVAPDGSGSAATTASGLVAPTGSGSVPLARSGSVPPAGSPATAPAGPAPVRPAAFTPDPGRHARPTPGEAVFAPGVASGADGPSSAGAAGVPMPRAGGTPAPGPAAPGPAAPGPAAPGPAGSGSAGSGSAGSGSAGSGPAGSGSAGSGPAGSGSAGSGSAGSGSAASASSGPAVAGAAGVAGADPKARRRRTTLLSIVAAVVVLGVAGLLWWQFPAGDRGNRGDRGGAQAAPGPVFSGEPTSAAPSATSPAARRSGRAQVQKPGAAVTTNPPAAGDQPPGGGAPRTTTPAAGGDGDGDGDGGEEPEPTTTAPTTDPPAQERTLSSAAGSVRATCPSPSTAELLSWSATKPYKVNDVDQGPAASAAVVFKHGNRLVRMTVTCSGGVPSGSTDEG